MFCVACRLRRPRSVTPPSAVRPDSVRRQRVRRGSWSQPERRSSSFEVGTKGVVFMVGRVRGMEVTVGKRRARAGWRVGRGGTDEDAEALGGGAGNRDSVMEGGRIGGWRL